MIVVLEKGKPIYRKSLSNVLRAKRIVSKDHPHEKPLGLLSVLIENSTSQNDVVLDPFAGTGTTCMAAKNLDRRFIGIECERRWVDVARGRIKVASPCRS